MPFFLHPPRLKTVPPYVFFKGIFTPEECQKLIEIGNQQGWKEGKTGGHENKAQDKKIRSSQVAWLDWSPENDWFYQKLSGVVNDIRANWYPFNLVSFEQVQLTKYEATENGHYSWHQDQGDDPLSTRKLSLVILLTPRDQFKGGELEIFSIPGEDKKVKELEQGTVVAFAGFTQHRVLPITEGTRLSAVVWVHGPPFQ